MITAACVQYRVQQGHTVATKYLLKERERRESGRKEKRRKERVKKGLQVVFFFSTRNYFGKIANIENFRHSEQVDGFHI